MRLVSLKYVLGATLSLMLASGFGRTAEDVPFRLQTNQSYIEQLNANGSLDIADRKAVFGHVLNNLPDRVKIYPTENYYYFTFHHRSVRYTGNIRLENDARDRGKVHFVYSIESNLWSERYSAEVFTFCSMAIKA